MPSGDQLQVASVTSGSKLGVRAVTLRQKYHVEIPAATLNTHLRFDSCRASRLFNASVTFSAPRLSLTFNGAASLKEALAWRRTLMAAEPLALSSH